MATGMMTTRPPLPPFARETAIQKMRLAEDGWNTRDPGGKVALAYAIDSRHKLPSISFSKLANRVPKAAVPLGPVHGEVSDLVGP
jgi:nuclear transport factor 2 (NTF2) superfamily protein